MTIRESLTGRKKAGKLLDMERIYRELDMGMTVEDVAKEWGVSKSTLYRRHRSYQEEARLVMDMEREEDLPPLPDAFPAQGERKGT